LKVRSLSSVLLKDLYEVIEKKIGSDCILKLVTLDGKVLPACGSSLTLATALDKPSDAPSPPPTSKVTPPTSQPVKVVTISTRSMSLHPHHIGVGCGFEVVGTNMAGNEVCCLKVRSLSSVLLKDLYEVIEKKIGSDCIPKLVTLDGKVLPADGSSMTLATALDKPSDAPSRVGASLRKWLGGIASKARRKQ